MKIFRSESKYSKGFDVVTSLARHPEFVTNLTTKI